MVMKVSVVCKNRSVPKTSFDDPIVLDLVSHLLGIVTHDNNNADPFITEAIEVVVRPKLIGC